MQEQRSQRALALVGPGRAGLTVAAAATHHGFRVSAIAGRNPQAASTVHAGRLLNAPATDVEHVARNADLVVLATPDSALESAAARLAASLEPGALVVHLAGALGCEVFDSLVRAQPATRVGAIHPLRSLQRPESAEDAVAQLRGAACAVGGDSQVAVLAAALGMRPFSVDDDRRAMYHATAAVASNHLVALAGQVERLAAQAGVPVEVFLGLMRGTLDNVGLLGAAGALTGPVARGDVATVEAHLAAIPAGEQPAYRALAREALRLVEQESPALAALLGSVTDVGQTAGAPGSGSAGAPVTAGQVTE